MHKNAGSLVNTMRDPLLGEEEGLEAGEIVSGGDE